MARSDSPRDRFITVYGRNPVLEALADPGVEVDKVVLADRATGPAVGEILDAAKARGVPVQRATADRVKLLSGNGRHDQGVLADVVATRMATLDSYLATHPRADDQLLLLDGVTTPANVGMILRTATAAGIDGVVVPHRGVARLDPMVVKASAGVAFRAPVLRTGTAGEAARALRAAGRQLVGLAASASASLFAAELPSGAAYVLGGEAGGVGDEVAHEVTTWCAIPMAHGVESLNVAGAAAVVAFELARRREAELARRRAGPGTGSPPGAE